MGSLTARSWTRSTVAILALLRMMTTGSMVAAVLDRATLKPRRGCPGRWIQRFNNTSFPAPRPTLGWSTSGCSRGRRGRRRRAWPSRSPSTTSPACRTSSRPCSRRSATWTRTATASSRPRVRAASRAARHAPYFPRRRDLRGAAAERRRGDARARRGGRQALRRGRQRHGLGPGVRRRRAPQTRAPELVVARRAASKGIVATPQRRNLGRR